MKECFVQTTNPLGESSFNNGCKRRLNNIEGVSNMQVINLARIASVNFINLASGYHKVLLLISNHVNEIFAI